MTPNEAQVPELPGGFSRRTVGWSIGISAIAFAALVALAVRGDDPADHPKAGPSTLSYSALGHRGLADFLRRQGLGVTSQQDRRGAGLGARRPLVVAEPSPASSASASSRLTRLTELVEEAHTAGAPLVVVLPKWSGVASRGRPDWVDHAALLSLGTVEGALADLDEEDWSPGKVERLAATAEPHTCRVLWSSGAGTADLEIDARPLQLLIPSPALTPEVTCGAGLLVARLAGKPEILLVADPDLINNQGLGRSDHAALAWALFTERLGAQGVVFDETIHGYRKNRGLLAEAFRYPLLPATLQGLLLVGFILWAGMGRFGKPLPSTFGLPVGKEVLTDNTAQLLTRGGHGLDSLRRYYQQTLRAVAARYALLADLPEAELARRLGEIATRRGSPFDLAGFARRLETLGHRAGAGRPGLPGPQAAALAQRLYDWRMEMIDGQ